MEHYDGIIRLTSGEVEVSFLDFEPLSISCSNIHLYGKDKTPFHVAFDFYLKNEEEYEKLKTMLNDRNIRIRYMSVEEAAELGMAIKEGSVLIVVMTPNLFVFYREYPEELRKLY